MVVVFSSLSFAQNQGNIQVEDIVICTSVEGRQPVGGASVFSADVGRLYCYTKLTSQMDSYAVSHVWFHGEQQMAKVEMMINERTWRTWSSKKIVSGWKGDWRVEIQDSAGNVISKISFKVQ
jgi:hypothetical protein